MLRTFSDLHHAWIEADRSTLVLLATLSHGSYHSEEGKADEQGCCHLENFLADDHDPVAADRLVVLPVLDLLEQLRHDTRAGSECEQREADPKPP